MAQYCTVTDVSNELNGFTIDASSTPSLTTVTTWIEQESALLDKETGRSWGINTVTDEYHDYDSSGSILLDHAPVISITSLSTERNGVDGDTEDWDTLLEGRTNGYDFYVYKDEGDVIFHGDNTPYKGYKNIKVSYTWGYSSTNEIATMIVAKQVALRVISTVISGSTTTEGGSVTVGAISISDPSTFSLERVKQLKEDITELKSKLGTFKTYRINRRYD